MAFNIQRSLLRADLQRSLNKIPIRAILGDASGRIYDPLNPNSGYVYVRQQTSNGYSTAQRVRGPYQGSPIQMVPGNPVVLKYDTDGQLCIAGPDFQGAVAVGTNPNVNNAADENANQWTNQASIVTLVSHCTAPPSLSVLVRGWMAINSLTLTWFSGSPIDLASFVPSAGNQCLVVIVIKSDYATLAAYASTAKDSTDVLTTADLQEALTAAKAADANAVPIWAWRLHDAQTTITDPDSWLDLRQFINIGGTATSAIKIDFIQTATVTINNSAAETTLTGSGVGSLTLAANEINAAGDDLYLVAWGVLSTLGAAPGTLNIKFKLGGTTVVSTGAQTLPLALSNALWELRIRLTTRSTGATGTVLAQGKFYINNTLVDTIDPMSNAVSTVTLDLTSALVADVTETFSTANPSNSISCTNLQLGTEVIGGGGGGSADLSAAVIIAPTSDTRNLILPTGDFIALIIKAVATPTKDLQQWLKNDGTVYAKITKDGQLILENSAVGQFIARGLVNQRGVVYIDNAGAKGSLLQLADGDVGKYEFGLTADANLAFYMYSSVTTWSHMTMYPSNKQWDFRGASFTYINANSYVTPDASALAQWESTTQAILIPRMTTTQRDAIASPANGLILYNSTTGFFTVRQAGAWVEMGSGGGGSSIIPLQRSWIGI